MTTNYFTLENMHGNLYIGTGAGKHLKAAIENAKESIKIVSPYLSIKLIDDLVIKAQSNVNVTLITMDGNDSTERGNLIHHLVQQYRYINPYAKHVKKVKQITYSLIFAISVGLFLLGLIWGLTKVKLPLIAVANSGLNIFLFGLLICFTLSAVFLPLLCATTNIKIYDYVYQPLLHFRFFKKQRNSNFIHSKIFVIDNTIAFLGSLNYTHAGCETNLETCIKVTDELQVKRIGNYVEQLFNDSGRSSYYVDELIGLYFSEPIH